MNARPHDPSAFATWHAKLLLTRPQRVLAHLRRLQAAGLIETLPTAWQLELVVLRMWHRVFFRSDTIGTSAGHAPRPGWRAKLLNFRPLRGPFLAAERAIAPFDHTGLGQGNARLCMHLLAAHHDGDQFAYDLQILQADPDALKALRREARAVVDGTHPRAAWLRDLVVYEGYHEALLAAVDRAIAGEALTSDSARDNPDIRFDAMIAWALRQPPTPSASYAAWRDATPAEAAP